MTSTADLLDLNVGIRTDTFWFDLLDSGHNPIGTLYPSLDAPPHVRNDTTRTTFRTCTGLSIPRATLADINPLTDRLRVRMGLQNGEDFPLGVFMFGQDVRSPRSWGSVWTPDLFDETFAVDQPLDATVGLAPGDSILTLINSLVAQVNLPDVDFSGVADAYATTSATYAAGTSRNLAVVALFKLLGYYPPFFNNAGTYTAKPAPTSASGPDHIYNTGGRILAGTITTTNASYRSPNRWQVVGGSTTGAIVGVYDLPPSAPNSYAMTGVRVVQSDQQQGIPTLAIANLAAYINALTDQNTYVQAAFDSTADPQHGTFDLVQLLGVLMQETAWDIECKSGGAMTHNLSAYYPQ